MSKLVYGAVGVCLLVAAAVDHSGVGPQATEPVAPAIAAPGPVAAYASSASPAYAPAPQRAPAAIIPINPIPRAEDLGGKVIDDRFQPDG